MMKTVLRLLLVLSAATLAGWWARAAEFSTVDPTAAGFGTYNSNLQKIARNRHGTLLGYVKTRNAAYNAQVIKFVLYDPLGAKSEILTETWATNPPCIAASETGEFFAAFPNWSNNTLRVYIWRDISANTTPEVYTASLVGDGKYACVFDDNRRTIYYLGLSGTLVKMRVDTAWHLTAQLWTNGSNPAQYPALQITRDGSLHVFQNSITLGGDPHYRSIQYMVSPNDGISWFRSWTPSNGGGALTIPLGSDENGGSNGMSRSEDIGANTYMIAQLADDTTFRAVWTFTPAFAERCFAVERRCTAVYVEHSRATGDRTEQQVPIRTGNGHVLRPKGGGAMVRRKGQTYFVTTEQSDLVVMRVTGPSMVEVERAALPNADPNRCPYSLTAFSGRDSDDDIIGVYTMLDVSCATWATSTDWSIGGAVMKFRITIP